MTLGEKASGRRLQGWPSSFTTRPCESIDDSSIPRDRHSDPGDCSDYSDFAALAPGLALACPGLKPAWESAGSRSRATMSTPRDVTGTTVPGGAACRSRPIVVPSASIRQGRERRRPPSVSAHPAADAAHAISKTQAARLRREASDPSMSRRPRSALENSSESARLGSAPPRSRLEPVTGREVRRGAIRWPKWPPSPGSRRAGRPRA